MVNGVAEPVPLVKVEPTRMIALLDPAPVLVVVIVEDPVLKFKAPLALINTVPEPLLIAAELVMAPVLVMDVLPLPLWLMPVRVSVVAVLTN